MSFEEFYSANYQFLVTWIRAKYPAEDADNLAMDAFVNVMKNYDPTRTHAGWLFVAAKSLAIKNLTHYNRVPIVFVGDDELQLLVETSPLETSSKVEFDFSIYLETLMHRAKLTPTETQIIHSFYYEGIKLKDIANKLNISINTAISTKQRSLYKLWKASRDYPM